MTSASAPSVQIRAASDPDFQTITEITNHYIATTSIHFAHELLADGELAAHWHHTRARYPWLVAVDNEDAVVGYAKAGVWRERAAYAWSSEVGLYVAPAAHGRGIGRALYSELLRQLTERGFRSAIAVITLPNDPSI